MERYLCVNGVEISNPCRTLAYARNVGNKCIEAVYTCTCCCEDSITPTPDPGGGLAPGTFTVTSSEGDGTYGLAFTGDGALVVATGYIGTLSAGLAPGPICDPGTPATPPGNADPLWATTVPVGLPASAVLGNPLSTFITTPGDPAACQITRFHLTLGLADVGDLYMIEDQTGGSLWFAWRPQGGTVGAWVDCSAFATISADYGAGVVGGGSTGGIDTFTDPVTDDAPWYDPADIRSADVLGVWLEEMTLGEVLDRKMAARVWGGALGPSKMSHRELHLKGKVLVTSRAGAEYARSWLYEALMASPCGEGGCIPPDASLVSSCPVEGDNGERTMHEVGLLGGSWQWQLDPAAPYECFVDFQATLGAQVPWLTKPPTVVHTGPVLSGATMCDICGTAIASGTPCPPREPSIGDLLCGCADQPARVVDTPARSECYTQPSVLTRHYIDVPSAKRWTDGALRITIVGGVTGLPADPSLRNLRIRGWANPLGLSTDEGDQLLCGADPCIDIEIGCVPYGTTMTIDGSTRRSLVSSGAQARSASPYLTSGSGRFVFPEYSCGGLMLAIDADGISTTTDSTITVETIEVERG